MRIKLVLVLLLVVPIIALGCGSSTSMPTSTPTSTLTPQEILSKSISAMANTTSCSMNIEAYESNTDFPSVGNKTPVVGIGPVWNSTEITGNSGTKEIVMNESSYGSYIAFHLFAADGKWNLTVSTNWNTSWLNGSTKNGSYDKWVPSDQYPQQIKLMTNATEVSLLEDETVNGIGCYTLNIKLPKSDMINWVYSLAQPTDPTDYSGWWGFSESLSRKTEIYEDAYENSSSVTVWVSQSNYLVVRINISALFEVLPEYLTQGEFSGAGKNISANTTCTVSSCGYFYKFDRSFYGQIDFYNYH